MTWLLAMPIWTPRTRTAGLQGLWQSEVAKDLAALNGSLLASNLIAFELGTSLRSRVGAKQSSLTVPP